MTILPIAQIARAKAALTEPHEAQRRFGPADPRGPARAHAIRNHKEPAHV